MRFFLAVPVLALSAFVLPGSALEAEPREQTPRLTRVFHLQEIDTRQAVTLLRSEVQVRQIAELRGLGVVVVSDTAEKLDRSETLLRERNAIVRAVEPHEPLDFDVEDAVATRVFRIEGLDTRGAVTVLRAIYQMREITERPEENTVTVRAPRHKLEASEALLRELGVLTEATERADGD